MVPVTEDAAQRSHVRVPVDRRARQRLHHDRVQALAKMGGQRLRRARARQRSGPANRALAGRTRRFVEQGALEVDDRVRRAHVRVLAAKQFEQHDAQRVNVACDARLLVLPLLGTGIAGRQSMSRHAPDSGNVAAGEPALELAGEAKVQQLDLAVSANQHIGWLQIVVKQLSAVDVLHSAQQLIEQAQATSQTQALVVSMLEQVLSRHMLHRQKGCSAGRCTRVQQSGNMGVRQLAQDAPLVQQQPGQWFMAGCCKWQLQRHPLRHRAIAAFGQPNLAHAPQPNAPQQAPGADASPGMASGRCRTRFLSRTKDGGTSGQEMVALQTLPLIEQAAQRIHQPCRKPKLAQPRLTMAGIQIQRQAHQVEKAGPIVRCNGRVHGPARPCQSWRSRL